MFYIDFDPDFDHNFDPPQALNPDLDLDHDHTPDHVLDPDPAHVPAPDFVHDINFDLDHDHDHDQSVFNTIGLVIFVR